MNLYRKMMTLETKIKEAKAELDMTSRQKTMFDLNNDIPIKKIKAKIKRLENQLSKVTIEIETNRRYEVMS